MSQTPSVRSIRQALLEQARHAVNDDVSLATLRQDLEACARGVRRAVDRAIEFASRGLVAEAASVIEDYPELAREAEALRTLSACDAVVAPFWAAHLSELSQRLGLPTQAEVEMLATIMLRAEDTRAALDALRISVLRGEPIPSRLRLLKRLRAADQRNRMWLDQIEALETAWLRRIAELRHKPDATRVELEEALAALESHEWVASVPRGLKDELFARVAPLRVGEAGDRYADLAHEIHDAAARMDRAELVRLEEAWAKINLETGRMPDPALAASVAPAFAWLTNLENEERARAAFEAEVERLEIMLNESRGVVEVERQIAVLRDARRESPEGLVERAVAYVAAERERVRRGHRLVLVASLAAAAVIGVVGVYLVRAAGVSRQRADDLAALNSAIEGKDVARTRGIAEAMRTRGIEANAAETAALKAADALVRARESRSSEIKRLVSDTSAELERGPARARVAALKDALASARADAEEPERIAIDGLERRRVDRLMELDQEAERASKLAVEAADGALKPWRLPSAWTDEAQCDPAEWARYIAALESTRGALGAAQDACAGYDAGLSRLALKAEAVDERLAEAKSRQEALRLALRELDPVQLCAPVTVEADFGKRLASALATHGAVLARQRRLADFEAARDFGPAWDAIQAWREDARPRLAALLGQRLDGDVAVEQRPRVLEILNEFSAKFPASPLADAIKNIAVRFDAVAASTLWPAERVAQQLQAARLADLEEVALVDGRRFYRRPEPSGDPRNRAVENLADLLTDADKLDSILSVRKEDIAAPGKPVANEVSLAWASAIERLTRASSGDVRAAMVDLLSSIARSKSDVLLRLRALREACDVLEQSGSMPSSLAGPIGAWRELVRKTAADAVVADWARAVHEPEVNFRKERRAAESAVAAFPSLSSALEASRAEQGRVAALLQPLVPYGVLAPAASGTPRAIVGRRESGRFVVVVRAGSGWELVDIVARDGAVEQAAILPKGPILVFRRLNP